MALMAVDRAQRCLGSSTGRTRSTVRSAALWPGARGVARYRLRRSDVGRWRPSCSRAFQALARSRWSGWVSRGAGPAGSRGVVIASTCDDPYHCCVEHRGLGRAPRGAAQGTRVGRRIVKGALLRGGRRRGRGGCGEAECRRHRQPKNATHAEFLGRPVGRISRCSSTTRPRSSERSRWRHLESRGRKRAVRVQVLTNSGALDRDRQPAVVDQWSSSLSSWPIRLSSPRRRIAAGCC